MTLLHFKKRGGTLEVWWSVIIKRNKTNKAKNTNKRHFYNSQTTCIKLNYMIKSKEPTTTINPYRIINSHISICQWLLKNTIIIFTDWIPTFIIWLIHQDQGSVNNNLAPYPLIARTLSRSPNCAWYWIAPIWGQGIPPIHTINVARLT